MRYLILFLIGCSANNPNVFDPKDGDIQDVSTDVQEDTTIPVGGGYVACVEMTIAPTSYPRLLERSCIDSNGEVYVKDYWDLNLGIGCRWNPSMTGIRCLPENEISSPIYADGICSQGIAPMEVSHQTPIEPFIGLDHYDGGTMDYIDMFRAGSLYDGDMYHAENWNGEISCVPFYLHFPGTRMFYVGLDVDPSIFVLK